MSPFREVPGDVDAALAAFEDAPSMMLACEGPDLILRAANATGREVVGERAEFGTSLLDVVAEPGWQELARVAATVQRDESPLMLYEWHAGWRHPLSLVVSPWVEDESVRGVLVHGGQIVDHPVEEAAVLQDTLLPPGLPVLESVDLAARYLLSADESAAGGDWFDAVCLDADRVALIVGDVATQGVDAVAAMGQLRAVARERLAAGATVPAATVSLDRFAALVPDARAATVCLAVLDCRDGTLEYCTAGHPPPLVVASDGSYARYLEGTLATPLGFNDRVESGTARLAEGDLLVLYTDGVLERPGRELGRSTVELGEVARDALRHRSPDTELSADAVCDQVVDRITRQTGHLDDISMLVCRRREAVADLALLELADQRAPAALIGGLADWLHELGVREIDHIALQYAVDVVLTNVVEHAYVDEPTGQVALRASLRHPSTVEVAVSDHGRWRGSDTVAGARTRSEGRGLRLARQMVDQLVVHHGEAGTTVLICHEVSRAVPVLNRQPGVPMPLPVGGEPSTFRVSLSGHRMRVAGPVGPVQSDELASAIADQLDEGDLVVDLSGVTHLPGIAVDALFGAVQQAGRGDHDLTIHAPAGSVAQQVLDVARLEHR